MINISILVSEKRSIRSSLNKNNENTRGDCMKREKYIRIIVISLIMTLTLLLKMCECITVPWTILCDFIAMIGGGILCSTIVSWIIDEQNKNKEKRAREEQRKYIFSSVKNSFIRLFERELFQLSN